VLWFLPHDKAAACSTSAQQLLGNVVVDPALLKHQASSATHPRTKRVRCRVLVRAVHGRRVGHLGFSRVGE
jgi:hypothetical protein